MSAGYAIRLTPAVAKQIAQADAWWRDHRLSAPSALTDELKQALNDLDILPDSGQPVPDADLAGVRRVYIKRIHYHLYYRVIADRREIEILAFWHASRGSLPPL